MKSVYVTNWLWAFGAGVVFCRVMMEVVRTALLLREFLFGCLTAVICNSIADTCDHIALRKGGIAGIHVGLAGHAISLLLAMSVTFLWTWQMPASSSRMFVAALLGFYLAFLMRRVILLHFASLGKDERR